MEHVRKTYGVPSWSDAVDLLTSIARKTGRLLKGGEPDLNSVAKRILSDWQRGKLPWFVAPPDSPNYVPPTITTAEEKKNAETAPQIAQMFSNIAVVHEFEDQVMDEKDQEGIFFK